MKKMKDSRCIWIGSIPNSWKTRRIKYLATLKGRIGWQGLTSDEYQDEGALLITGVDFCDGRIDWDNCVHVPLNRWEEAKDIQIENGDLLITKDGTVGKVAIVSELPDKASLNSGVLRIITHEGYSRRFLYWVLQSSVFWNWFNYKNAGNSTIQHLYQGDFEEFVYAFPCEQEQIAIADYLDDKCSKIDSIISDIQKQIILLKKYRKSYLIETITQKSYADAEKKNSGISWIGNIPRDWSICRIKDICSVSSGSTPDRNNINYWDGKICWIKTGELQNNEIYDSEEKITELAVVDTSVSILPKGTILMAMYGQGKTRGMTAMLRVESTTNQACAAINVIKTGVLSEYVWWYLISAYDAIREEAQGSGQPNLSVEIVKNFKMIIPDEKNQRIIVDELSKQVPLIEECITQKEECLSSLRKLRESLIYEYVTGKKRILGYDE